MKMRHYNFGRLCVGTDCNWVWRVHLNHMWWSLDLGPFYIEWWRS